MVCAGCRFCCCRLSFGSIRFDKGPVPLNRTPRFPPGVYFGALLPPAPLLCSVFGVPFVLSSCAWGGFRYRYPSATACLSFCRTGVGQCFPSVLFYLLYR